MASGGMSEDGDVGFQIAPMVDVVFVLLLFFMASAGSHVVEKELNISLPSGRGAKSAAAIPTTPIIIDIRSDGGVVMNNQEYDSPADRDLPKLRAWFTETFEQYGADDPVLLRPDPQARHERVMDVLNAAAASGVTKLSFL